MCATATATLLRLLRKLIPASLRQRTLHVQCDDRVSVLDPEVFRELRDSLGGHHEALTTIYMKFIGSASAHLANLRTQPHAAHGKTLHTLKGSAAMVGANRIVAIATQLHERCSELQRADIQAAARELERELAEFRRVLDTRLHSPR